MTATKPKIAIVAGEVSQPRALLALEPLRDAFDTMVFVLDGPGLRGPRSPTGLKLRVFENVPDMPGYMRGLEEELAGYDAVIGLETSRLATFQAVRAARKHGMPLGVVVSEFQPYFYDRYPNIRAIQFDICNKADLFWTTSRLAAQTLLLDRVAETAIRPLRPAVDATRFRPDDARRAKFRGYVGIAPDDVVLLFRHELTGENRPAATLDALRLVYQSLALTTPKIRLVLAGDGPLTMDLKYRAYDSGLGRAVLFLQQDAEPFLQDLYAASDLTLMPRPLRGEHHEELPLGMLEAMACGVAPVVGAGSVAAELAGDAGLVFGADEPEALAATLSAVLLSSQAIAAARAAARAQVEAHYRHDRDGRELVEQVEHLLRERRVDDAPRRVGGAMINAIRQELARGEPRAALVRIEEALLVGTQVPEERAAIFRMKGDAHYQLGALEEAQTAYGESLRCEEKNPGALRGLGFVSWQSHSNEEALIFFRRALALAPEDAETLYGIGLVYRRLGLVDEALFWLERCVTGVGAPVSASIALAQSCLQCANPQTGAAVLERVLDSLGDQKSLLMALGQLYLALGRAVEAQELLTRADHLVAS